ncbi:hypothetical protein EDC04DRAFT_3144451 [Pisolithus marmoratus]|nr:hypothetical protein EDC04DRAFT_3144451 [Pisolithus marmoratus]
MPQQGIPMSVQLMLQQAGNQPRTDCCVPSAAPLTIQHVLLRGYLITSWSFGKSMACGTLGMETLQNTDTADRY